LIKPGIWGSALDVLLTGLREVLREESSEQFPDEALEKVMRARGKSLTFTDEEMQELVDMKYGARDLFGLLTLLFPFVDTRNQFHVDHIFPRAGFHARKLKDSGFSPEQIERMEDLKERLPNLQLLGGSENQSKQDTMPAQWIANTYPGEDDRKDYIERHALDGATSDLRGFEAFYSRRRGRLLDKILCVLNAPAAVALEN
jgi:hypothetical protein